MGAIAGLVYGDGRSVSDDETGRLAAAGEPRGIDGTACWASGAAGLVRFRHATTPEALGERQPRPGDASGWVMCFDGRLDNRAELLGRLGRHGEALRTRPDDEIALALFEAEGDGFLARLTGDFALAIWLPEQQRLVCARGPVGFRPFYYVADDHRFAFATEPRTLIRGLGLDRRINEGAIAEYLTRRVVSAEDSMWAGIPRLPQGAALDYRRGKLRRWQWDDATHDDLSHLSEAEHVERFNALFDKALLAVTRSTTHVVAQLSGGLDSSSVLCRATELHRAGRIDRPVSAITARFPGEDADEGEWSGLVEQKLGITADVVSGGIFDPAATAAWCAESLHLPLRPNTLDTFQGVFRRMRSRGERVLLTGDGGDEFLNGNHAYWLDEMRRGRVDRVVRDAFSRPGVGAVQALRDIAHGAVAPFVRPDRSARIAHRQSWAGTPFDDWVNPDWLTRVGLAERLARAASPVALSGTHAQNIHAVLHARGADHGFDAFSAFGETLGVEIRHPLYDRDLLRFYLGASGAVLFRGGERKHLLREAMRGTLPEPIRLRRSKAGFNAQTLDGLDILLRTRPIADMAPVRLGWVDGAKLTAIWNDFWRWRANDTTAPLPNGAFGALWATAALDVWLTHAVGI